MAKSFLYFAQVGKLRSFSFLIFLSLRFLAHFRIFLILFIDNLSMQNEIESKMDEVANHSSNFICHRTEKANTQARGLVSQALLHQTNTGDSSRFHALNVLLTKKLAQMSQYWNMSIFLFFSHSIICVQETVEDTGSEGPDPDKIVRRRRRYTKPPRSVVNPDENFYFYWLMVLTTCVLYNLWALIVRQSFPELQVSRKLWHKSINSHPMQCPCLWALIMNAAHLFQS